MALIKGSTGGQVQSSDGQLSLTIPPSAFAGPDRNILILDSPIRATSDGGGWIVHKTWVIFADGAFATQLLGGLKATFHHAQVNPDWPGQFVSHQIVTPMPDGGDILAVPGGSPPGLVVGETDYLPTKHAGGAVPSSTTSCLSLLY